MNKYYFITFSYELFSWTNTRNLIKNTVTDKHPFVWLKENKFEYNCLSIINYKEISKEEFDLYEK